MRKIIISPFAKPLRNGKENPKNYPFWEELILLLKKNEFYIIQIGVDKETKFDVDKVVFNASLKELEKITKECDLFLGIDNFFQHFCSMIGKKGIAIFGKSDPKIFGHDENIIIIKDEKYLRKNQFDTWENEKFDPNCFVKPLIVLNQIQTFFSD